MICGRLSITNLWFAGSNSGESGVVIRTYDGGTTRVNTQAVKNGEVNAIHFSDDQKGWAIGSRVSRTNNGDLTDVHYTDA